MNLSEGKREDAADSQAGAKRDWERIVSKVRKEFLQRAHEEAGISAAELGRMVGRSHVAVAKALKGIWDKER